MVLHFLSQGHWGPFLRRPRRTERCPIFFLVVVGWFVGLLVGCLVGWWLVGGPGALLGGSWGSGGVFGWSWAVSGRVLGGSWGGFRALLGGSWGLVGWLVGCLVGLRLVENGAGNVAWCNFLKTVYPRLCSCFAFLELSLESGAVF